MNNDDDGYKRGGGEAGRVWWVGGVGGIEGAQHNRIAKKLSLLTYPLPHLTLSHMNFHLCYSNYLKKMDKWLETNAERNQNTKVSNDPPISQLVVCHSITF